LISFKSLTTNILFDSFLQEYTDLLDVDVEQYNILNNLINFNDLMIFKKHLLIGIVVVSTVVVVINIVVCSKSVNSVVTPPILPKNSSSSSLLLLSLSINSFCKTGSGNSM
jgi:hypothetical protein